MGISRSLPTTLHSLVAFLGSLRATEPQAPIETTKSTGEQFELLPLIRRTYTADLDGNLYRTEVRGLRSRWGNQLILQRTQRVEGVLSR